MQELPVRLDRFASTGSLVQDSSVRTTTPFSVLANVHTWTAVMPCPGPPRTIRFLGRTCATVDVMPSRPSIDQTHDEPGHSAPGVRR
ncbi:hypothetical protein [Embleya sp. MST-111070]|uniref:hypothetical protein n=1 Tax=Embleya sp. MST-111070 TaxID=3398231 RepID=UPI003F73E3C6